MQESHHIDSYLTDIILYFDVTARFNLTKTLNFPSICARSHIASLLILIFFTSQNRTSVLYFRNVIFQRYVCNFFSLVSIVIYMLLSGRLATFYRLYFIYIILVHQSIPYIHAAPDTVYCIVHSLNSVDMYKCSLLYTIEKRPIYISIAHAFAYTYKYILFADIIPYYMLRIDILYTCVHCTYILTYFSNKSFS